MRRRTAEEQVHVLMVIAQRRVVVEEAVKWISADQVHCVAEVLEIREWLRGWACCSKITVRRLRPASAEHGWNFCPSIERQAVQELRKTTRQTASLLLFTADRGGGKGGDGTS